MSWVSSSPPAAGGLALVVAVEDSETGERGVIDCGSSRVRRAYAEHAEHERLRLNEEVRRTGGDMLSLSTGEPYEIPLVRFFRERAHRAAMAGG